MQPKTVFLLGSLAIAAPMHAATTAPSMESPALSAESEEAKLAMQLNNPVAALISVPFQSNWDFGIGPKDATQYMLKVQPVIPITLNSEWNLISRTILPVIDQESPAIGVDSTFGLGDTTQSFFFSPKNPTDSGIIWGAGPILLFPTATDDLLGNNMWGAGPTALILRQHEGWTYGALASQLWSIGSGDETVNSLYLQPFISYTTEKHTTIGLNSETSYQWESDQLSTPFNLMVSQLLKIGDMPIQLQLGGRWYAWGPDDGPDWGVRLAVTFLFPKE